MRVTVLNGPNLNLLGLREPELYGQTTLAGLEAMVRAEADRLGVAVTWFQSNHEGALIDAIQALPESADGAILNAGAFSHTSLAVRDAILAVRVPFVEVHLTNIYARESARRQSLTADLARAVVAGLGPSGYLVALQALHARHHGG